MKRTQRILINLFLAGMLFTVFQYLPFLEEEAPGHRTELVKKLKGTDSDSDADDSGDADDSDNDDDLKTEMIASLFDYYSFSQASHDNFYIKVPLYSSRVADIHTPPPKA